MTTTVKYSFVLLVLGVASFSSTANAGGSANVGYVTDYYFRGIELGDAGAYAGFDYEQGGFYAGTWLINDGGEGGDTTVEYDVYGGYNHEFSSDLSAGLGFTAYNYEYSSAQQTEINLSLGYKFFGFEYADGEDVDATVDAGGNPTDAEYEYIALSLSGDVYGVTYGTYDYDDLIAATNDAAEGDYSYLEFSAGGTISELDFSVSLGVTDFEEDSATPKSSDVYILLDVSKTFDLF